MPLIQTKNANLGTASLLLAGGTVVAAPFFLGGVTLAGHLGLTSAALVAFALHVAARARDGRGLLLGWSEAFVATLIVLTALSLMPLPWGLRALLDPEGSELKRWVGEALASTGTSGILPVLALDPSDAALGLLRLIGAFCVLAVISDRARRRDNRELLFRILVIGGALLVLACMAETFLNLPQVSSSASASLLRGPLVNPNHLARVLGTFSLLATAHAVESRNRTIQVIVGSVAVTLAVATLLTYSRGAMVAYGVIALGLALSWLTGFQRDRRSVSTTGTHVVGPLVGLLAIGGTIWVAGEEVLGEIGSISEELTPAGEAARPSKSMLYGPAWRLALAHPWTGVGTGGFRTSLPAVLSPGELAGHRFSHVENVVLEVLTARGVVLGALVFFLAMLLAWATLRKLDDGAERLPLAALAFLLLGELFDFVLQIPAGAFLAATAAGLASASALHRGAPFLRWPAPAAAGTAFALVALGVAAALVAREGDRPSRDAEIEAAEATTYVDAVTRALASHPLETHYAYLLARHARRQRDPVQAISWASRAMVLDPNNGSAHKEAARALWALGKTDQAILEYRLAWLTAPLLRRGLVEEVARRTPDFRVRLRAVTQDDPDSFRRVCERIGKEKRHEVADACWQDALVAHPDDAPLRDRAIESALTNRDGKAALERLEPRLKRRPLDGTTARRTAAATALIDGQEAAFARGLELRQEVKVDPYPLEEWIIIQGQILGRYREVLETVQRARQTATRSQRFSLDRTEAHLAERMGNRAEALTRWRKLAEQPAERRQAKLEQARLELDLGLLPQAEASLGLLRKEGAEETRIAPLERRLGELRAKATPAPGPIPDGFPAGSTAPGTAVTP